MAEYRTVKKGTYRDPYMLSLKPQERFLYLWLFTNDYINTAGIMEVAIPTITFETNIQSPDPILAKFRDSGKIVIDGDLIWIKNFVRNQFSKVSPNIQKAVLTCLESCRSKTIVYEFSITYDNIPLTSPLLDAVKGMGSTLDTLRDSDTLDTLDTIYTPKKEPIQRYIDLATDFLGKQRTQFPKESAWRDFECCVLDGAKNLELFDRKNNWTTTEIEEVVHWVITDSFWRSQIRTLGGIRKKGNNGAMKLENAKASMNGSKEETLVEQGRRLRGQ